MYAAIDKTFVPAPPGGMVARDRVHETRLPTGVGRVARDRRRWVAFYLEGPDPPTNIAGEYSLNLTVDGSACINWPAEARSRHCTATISPNTNSRTSFRARLGGASFYSKACPGAPPDVWCPGYSVNIGVAGNYASFFLGVLEQLSETTYLIVEAGGAGPWSAGITTPVNGYLEYCSAEPVLIDQGDWTCPVGGAVAACESTNHQLAFVTR